MSLKNCCKITKKSQNGQDKTGKQSCQIFNFLSIKKKVTFRSGKATFFSYLNSYSTFKPFYIILMHIIWEEILHKSYTYLVVWNIEGV